MTHLRQVFIFVTVLFVASGAFAPAANQASDQQTVERQYRIARRLAAEGSAEAAAALEKVIALDPDGELADDALVDHALLLGAASWPEDLGLISGDASKRATSMLDRVLTGHAAGDRAVEARYLRALSRLEPFVGYDASAARLALLDIASRAPGGAWDRRARYTRAWLDERQGNDERALASYQRLLVDAPDSPCADRARLGRARALLRRGDPGHAARLLQEAIDRGVKDPAAPALREVAVRSLLRGLGRLPEIGPLETVVPSTGIRQLVGMAALPSGGMLLAGRPAGVLRFDAVGAPVGHWELEQLQAVAVDAQGVAFAAAGDHLVQLDPGGRTRELAGLGDYAPVSALTIDGEGAFWLLDRRGDRLAVLERGAGAPVVVWQVKGKRLNAIEWDGSRIIAVDTRNKAVLAVERNGNTRPLVTALGDRPGTLSADPTGRMAVLDPRAGIVFLIAAERSSPATFSLKNAGVGRASAAEFGTDGSLHVFDGANGAWLRFR